MDFRILEFLQLDDKPYWTYKGREVREKDLNRLNEIPEIVHEVYTYEDGQSCCKFYGSNPYRHPIISKIPEYAYSKSRYFKSSLGFTKIFIGKDELPQEELDMRKNEKPIFREIPYKKSVEEKTIKYWFRGDFIDRNSGFPDLVYNDANEIHIVFMGCSYGSLNFKLPCNLDRLYLYLNSIGDEIEEIRNENEESLRAIKIPYGCKLIKKDFLDYEKEINRELIIEDLYFKEKY